MYVYLSYLYSGRGLVVLVVGVGRCAFPTPCRCVKKRFLCLTSQTKADDRGVSSGVSNAGICNFDIPAADPPLCRCVEHDPCRVLWFFLNKLLRKKEEERRGVGGGENRHGKTDAQPHRAALPHRLWWTTPCGADGRLKVFLTVFSPPWEAGRAALFAGSCLSA